jgi:hypothetical protein
VTAPERAGKTSVAAQSRSARTKRGAHAFAAALLAATWTATAAAQQVGAGTNCPLPPGDYERAGYRIRTVDVHNLFDFARHVTTSAGQPGVTFPAPGGLFRVQEAPDAAQALQDVLAARSVENESPFSVTIVVDFIDHCTGTPGDAPGSGQLDLVYRAITNRIPLLSGITFESRSEQASDPAEAAGALKASRVLRLTPRFGYTKSDGFESGGQFGIRAPAVLFDRIDVDGFGARSSHLVRGSLNGAHESAGAIAHSDWRVSWSDSKRPTDTASFTVRRLLGQLSAGTRPLGRAGAVARFGASLENGSQRTMWAGGPPSGSGPLSDLNYGALRTYAGVALGTARQAFAASYGLLLGDVPGRSTVDYRKHIVDSIYTVRQPVGDHRTLEVESRLTAGWLQHADAAPLAERFFGGNVPLDFIEGDAWRIRATPLIRSIPNGFLNRLSDRPGAGGEHFFSINITAAAPAWRLPLVPSEISRLMGFQDGLTLAKETARQQAGVYYRSKDPAQKKIERDAAAVDGSLRALLSQVQAVLPTAPPALRQPLADCSAALDLALDKMQHLDSTGFGPIATDIIPDALMDCDALLAATRDNAAIAAESTRLGALRDSIEASTRTFDEAAISRRVDGDLGFAFRALDTFIEDVNVVSLAPVAIFDAARLGPQPDAVAGGVRYGVGGGLRLSLMNVLNITAGYAVNPSPKPWETRGAFFFSLDIVDLFR